VHLQPQGGEKTFRCNLQGNFVSAPPAHHKVHPRQSKSQFGTFLLGEGYLEVGVVHLVVFDRLILRATTKKVVNFFEEKKCTPDKSCVMWPLCRGEPPPPLIDGSGWSAPALGKFSEEGCAITHNEYNK